MIGDIRTQSSHRPDLSMASRKGDNCGYIHQFDDIRMPTCSFFARFGEFREPNCIHKHTNKDTREGNKYFIVKCSNLENLELSAQTGIWATDRDNEGKLNEAFDTCANVILVFSVNRKRHFQGCARMTSKIGGVVGGAGWKYANGTSLYDRNFHLKWLKLCKLSFRKTKHLRNPLRENLPVKISHDWQQLEASIGQQLVSLLYLEPDSELMAVACAAESKREDEKAQGAHSAHKIEDPNRFGMGPADGFAMPDMFTAPAGQGRGFPPYGQPGPRFGPASGMMFAPMDGSGSTPGMVFQGRSHPPNGIFSHGGPAMMPSSATHAPLLAGNSQYVSMGAGRSNFMGGSGPIGRPSRGKGMPYRPPQGGNSGRGRKDQRRRKFENNPCSDRVTSGMDQRASGKAWQRQTSVEVDREPDYRGPSRVHHHDGYDYGNNSYTANNDESESEDEAPRRSRHGESKKRRRDWDGEEADQGDNCDLPAAVGNPEDSGY